MAIVNVGVTGFFGTGYVTASFLGTIYKDSVNYTEEATTLPFTDTSGNDIGFSVYNQHPKLTLNYRMATTVTGSVSIGSPATITAAGTHNYLTGAYYVSAVSSDLSSTDWERGTVELTKWPYIA